MHQPKAVAPQTVTNSTLTHLKSYSYARKLAVGIHHLPISNHFSSQQSCLREEEPQSSSVQYIRVNVRSDEAILALAAR